MMQYCRYNIDEELKKVTEGKKAKKDVPLLLYSALFDYPAIQRRIADAFSITEV